MQSVEVSSQNGITYLTLRNNGIKCPQCVYDGQSSSVIVGMGMRTSAGVNSYYDSGGRFHSHDKNATKGTWTCSNGHAGNITTTAGCPQANCIEGRQMLTTDPAQYKAAKEERRRIEEEKIKERKKNSPQVQLITPTTIDQYAIGQNTIQNTIQHDYQYAPYPRPTYIPVMPPVGTTATTYMSYNVPAVVPGIIQLKMTISGVEYEGTLYPVQQTVQQTVQQKSE